MKRRVLSMLLACFLLVGLVLPGGARVQAAGSKLLALTFDDGPGAYTEKLLDGLASKGVQVTFFTLGQRAESYPAVIRRIYTEGHQLCSHTYDHKNLPDLGTSGAIAQVNKTDGILNRLTGGSENYMLRAPYGNLTSEIRKKLNCPAVYWSVDTLDWKYRKTTYVKNQIIDSAYDGAIILLHDIHATTVDGALAAIDTLKKQGYEFVTVRELFRRRNVKMENGTVYYDCKPKGTDLEAVAAPNIMAEAAANGTKITISAGDTPVYYTLDGSAIGYGSKKYDGPFVVSSPCTIRAVTAYHLNGGRSKETKYEYTLPPATKALIEVGDGMLKFLNFGQDETVYYTLDGSDPTSKGIAYVEPVKLQSGITISYYTGGQGKMPTAVTTLHYSKQGNLFADVKPNAWYYDEMDTIASLGIMQGVGDFAYEPDGKLTRGMMITILYRMSNTGLPASRTNPFTDVKGSEYFGDAVEWGYRNQVINGMTPTTFQPRRNITRQEMAQMMANFLRYLGKEMPKDAKGAADGYKDRNKISKWALANVENITKLGLMRGDNTGSFCPQSSATRAEAATVLCRLHQMIG